MTVLPRSARPLLVLLSAAVLLATFFVGTSSATVAPTKKTVPITTVTTASGLRLSVQPARGLNPAGATVKVSGKGFNPLVGIYVALCVTPAKGEKPTPCGGGIDMTGTSKSQVWISSNPPPYAADLTTPYKAGGSFAVTLKVAAMIGDVDCRMVACSIVTRADHTRGDDRSYDVFVPVTFLR